MTETDFVRIGSMDTLLKHHGRVPGRTLLPGTLVLLVALLAIAVPPDAGALSPSLEAKIDREFQRGAGPKYCPGPGPVREGRLKPGQWNVTRVLVGRSLARARQIAKRRDCVIRVVKRNGKGRPVTDDLLFHRINVAVVKRSHRGKTFWMIKRINGIY